MTRKPGGQPSRREAGLRRLAAGRPDRIEGSLQQALQRFGTSAENQKVAELRALVDGVATSMPAGATLEQRARALWRLICGEIELSELVPDERAALRAALHLDPTNRESTIDKRLAFARDKGDFGVPAGYDALRHWWGDGVRKLGHAIDERLDYLHHHRDQWQEYFGTPKDSNEPRYRKPSPGAQPLFVDLFTTTVFMKGRFVHRRITERLVVAREEHVEYYTARALPEQPSSGVPVRALFGCRAETMVTPPGVPILTRLWFPTALQRGQRHWFSSEALINAEVVSSERTAINVEVDHHGIAPGERLDGVMPVRGLTIRIRFDEDNLPEACWWYADVTERERYVRPAAGDDRWLAVDAQGCLEHTFACACQPLANYGVAIAWPP